MDNTTSNLALPILLGLSVAPAMASLNAVDQTAYKAANGYFAAWYQDTHGQALDLCLSKATSSRVSGAYMCNLLPTPDVFDPIRTILFPSNFPDEAFWFAGEASITDVNFTLTYGAAIEAAFNSELPAAGNQISFARIRIRATVPVEGTYTIIHPYGVEVFDVNALDGKREINMTRDIGIGAPGDFSGALKGDIGPFLRSKGGPYVEFNPETNRNETFVGDPNVPEEVIGSPFGTNFVRIEGPGELRAETSIFAITGKLSEVTLPTPLSIQRATFSRGAAGANGTLPPAQVDMFTLAPPAPATQTCLASPSTSIAMQATATGAWYGQYAEWYGQPGGIVSFTADNSMVVPSTPMTKNTPVVDLVTISRAEYNLETSTLTVEASSSDRGGQPALSAGRFGNLVNGRLEVVLSPDQAANQIPPATVQVNSANGGSDSEDVVIIPH